jgi:hypothetical protein
MLSWLIVPALVGAAFGPLWLVEIALYGGLAPEAYRLFGLFALFGGGMGLLGGFLMLILRPLICSKSCGFVVATLLGGLIGFVFGRCYMGFGTHTMITGALAAVVSGGIIAGNGRRSD